jgi:hypothetical protein
VSWCGCCRTRVSPEPRSSGLFGRWSYGIDLSPGGREMTSRVKERKANVLSFGAGCLACWIRGSVDARVPHPSRRLLPRGRAQIDFLCHPRSCIDTSKLQAQTSASGAGSFNMAGMGKGWAHPPQPPRILRQEEICDSMLSCVASRSPGSSTEAPVFPVSRADGDRNGENLTT